VTHHPLQGGDESLKLEVALIHNFAHFLRQAEKSKVRNKYFIENGEEHLNTNYCTNNKAGRTTK